MDVVNPVLFGGGLAFLAIAAYFLYTAAVRPLQSDLHPLGMEYGDLLRSLLFLVPAYAGFNYLLAGFGIGFITVNGVEVALLRYFEWFVTTPLLLFGVLIVIGHRPMLGFVLTSDLVMIGAGLAAELAHGALMPVFFLLSVAGYCGVMYGVLLWGRDEATDFPPEVKAFFRRMRLFVAVTWSLYPVIWVLGPHGLAGVGTDTAHLLYLALDLSAKGGLAYLMASTMHTVTNVNLQGAMD